VLKLRGAGRRRRLVFAGATVGAAVLVIAPWAIYNTARFDEPVLLSTDVGATLLSGNCPPRTYEDFGPDSGTGLGYRDPSCQIAVRLDMAGQDVDESTVDATLRAAAVENITDNVDALGLTMTARVWRSVGIWDRPGTTTLVSTRYLMAPPLVTAWILSFLALVALAVIGWRRAGRVGLLRYPLVAPVLASLAFVLVAYGQPMFLVPATLGILVLAGAGLDPLPALNPRGGQARRRATAAVSARVRRSAPSRWIIGRTSGRAGPSLYERARRSGPGRKATSVLERAPRPARPSVYERARRSGLGRKATSVLGPPQRPPRRSKLVGAAASSRLARRMRSRRRPPQPIRQSRPVRAVASSRPARWIRSRSRPPRPPLRHRIRERRYRLRHRWRR
jgi:hypothetical protein